MGSGGGGGSTVSIMFTYDQSFVPCQDLTKVNNVLCVFPTTCAKSQTCVVNAMYVSCFIQVCGKEHTCLFIIKGT